MAEIVAVLLKNWRYVLVTLVLIGGLLYSQLLQHKVTQLAGTNTELTKQVGALTATNKDMQDVYEQRIGNLSGAISLQNKDINAYKKQIADWTKTVETHTKAAAETRSKYDKSVQEILTDGSLSEGATCDVSMDYLVKGAKDLKWGHK